MKLQKLNLHNEKKSFRKEDLWFHATSHEMWPKKPKLPNINVRFISYSKCWKCRRTWNFCFLLIFSWKKPGPNFAFSDTFKLLRCLKSKQIKLQSSIKVICTSFRPDFKKKTKIQNWTTISIFNTNFNTLNMT